VAHDRPTISTHVLDTATGTPRAGVAVRLRRPAADGSASIVGHGVTDDDGRIRDLLRGRPLEAGAYRLEFVLDPDGFFAGLTVDVRVGDTTRSCHVPLLVAPFSLATYRGS
jgi:5-hydroxyisourate hydrolase